MTEFQFPTEVVDLPSRGWFYPEGHPLTSGRIELYYMTAKHEDILTSSNLIRKGVVIDKLMEALVATKGVKYDDIFVGDKNAIMLASRVMGYGKNYSCEVTCPKCSATSDHEQNLEDIEFKEITFDPDKKGKNEFEYTLPFSGKMLTFKLLNHKDEMNINRELEQLRKAVKNGIDPEVTTRMRYSILSVDGDRSMQTISSFVQVMPVKDARAFREYARVVSPDIDFTFDFECLNCGHVDRLEVPITPSFFWPKL